MRTCIVSESKLFRAGLALILRNTAFSVQAEAETVRGVPETCRQQGVILGALWSFLH